jgi:uncharacterized protein (DUF58 family)
MKRRIIFFIFPLIIGLIASASGFTLVWRLFILSILVPVVSYLWTFINIRGLRSEIKTLPSKSQVGNILESHLRLTNLNKIPKLLLRVNENTDLPGYTNISAVNLPSKGVHDLSSKVYFTRRGQYSLGSFNISATDPIGLFPQSRTVGEPQKILIYPDTVELPFFDPLTYINQGYGAGRWLKSPVKPQIASIRDMSVAIV